MFVKSFESYICACHIIKLFITVLIPGKKLGCNLNSRPSDALYDALREEASSNKLAQLASSTIIVMLFIYLVLQNFTRGVMQLI